MKRSNAFCKLFSVLLAVILLISSIPTFSFTASAATSGYYTYTVTNGEATITDCDTSISGDIIIPDILGGYPVTSIGDYSFEYCFSLTAVTIPDSVTNIGNNAFSHCQSFTSITIPDSVTSIGWGAFQGCTSLTAVTIPDSVTSIGDCAFAGCGFLTSVTIPDSVTSIGWGAFMDCTNLKDVWYRGSEDDKISIVIDSYNTDFTNATWHYNSCIGKAEHIYTSDCDIQCDDCDWKREAQAEHKYTNVCDINCNICGFIRTTEHTYDNVCDTECNICGDIRTIDYSFLTYIVLNGEAKITGCDESISGDITLPATLGGCPVTSIGSAAFSNCSSLKSLTIPDSVTSIGDWVFYDCYSLTSVTIPNGVMSIGDYAFKYCTSLTSVTIPSSVTSIGDAAFSNCYSLTSVTIPDGVTSMSDCAFEGCASLTSITIPDSVTSIGDHTFYGCASLTSVTIPDSVTTIGESAFSGCTNVVAFIVYSNNQYFSSQNGVLFNKEKTELLYYPVGKTATTYTIPNSVTSIRDYAFSSCASLTSVTISDGVTSIGSSTFYNCTSLTSITIPDSVTSIGSHAFCSCESLASIDIPDSVTSIGNCAFQGCTSLTSITIPDSVTSIGSHAFRSCESLASIDIPDSVTSIGDFAFYVCESLTSVTIGKSVTNIGYRVFYGCKSLKLVTIPNSVTSIGPSAFEYCTNLKDVWYRGSEDNKNNITISSYNTALTNATWHYNSCIGKAEHTYNSDCDIQCDDCGWEREAQAEHIYDNACDAECNACTAVRDAGHNYVSGRCEKCNSYIESKHNYIEETDETWVITKENTASITITFSSDTFVEEDWDFIYIYDGNDSLIGEHTGGELASKSVMVLGNTAKIRLYSDKINTAYGFKVTNIEFACAHKYNTESKTVTCTENGFSKHTCEYCGDVYYTDEVQAIGHRYSSVVKEPTCIEGGYTTHTCENCGDSYIDTYTDATGIHIYENGNCTYCNGYLESDHNYTDLFDKTWDIYRKGATSITITFSSDTFVEQRYDYIYIYDANDNLIGEYTGDTLASKSVTVQGDAAKIRLKTDRSTTYYGFKVTDISAEYIAGDINGDKVVDARDIVRLKRVLAGEKLDIFASPDFDGDGVTTFDDLGILINLALSA